MHFVFMCRNKFHFVRCSQVKREQRQNDKLKSDMLGVLKRMLVNKIERRERIACAVVVVVVVVAMLEVIIKLNE